MPAPQVAFGARLDDLRTACARPSFETLARLSGTLRRSTISDALSGRSKPSMEFVVEFVQTCLQHAARTSVSVDPDLADMNEWLSRWRALQNPSAQESAPESSRGPSWPVPRQVPPRPGRVWGREAELAQLDSLEHDSLVVVTGMGGVGKSALVKAWAHQNRDRFPDGELWAGMRARDNRSLSPEAVVVSFLRALGLIPTSLPDTLPELVGLFRSVVAERSMLVVIDDAVDVEQVRPLLPAAARCTTIVTSRMALTGLSVAEGATRLTVSPLAPGPAAALLSAAAAERISADPGADINEDTAAELARLCGGLPLALRVVAERLQWESAADVCADLRDEHRRLAGLSVIDDPASSAQLVLTSTVEQMPAISAQVLRNLTLHPAPTFTVDGVAALTGLTRAGALTEVRALVQANLLEPHSTSRFRIHDLVRLAATQSRDRVDSLDEQRKAQRRLLEWFYRTAAAAARWVAPFLIRPEVERPKSDTPRFQTSHDALEWLTSELDALPSIVEAALAGGHHLIAAWLPIEFSVYTLRALPYTPSLALLDLAEAACRHLDEPRLRSVILNHRANLLDRLGLPEAARACYVESIENCLSVGEFGRAAVDQANIGWTWLATDDVEEALSCFTTALEWAEGADHHRTKAVVRCGMAEASLRTGSLDAAESFAADALAGFRKADELGGQADACTILARLASRRDQHVDAVQLATEAVHLYVQLADPTGQYETHEILAEIHERAGDMELAHQARCHARQMRDSRPTGKG